MSTHRSRATALLAGLAVSTLAATALTLAPASANAATPTPGPPGFARSWTSSVAVPAFPAPGGGSQPGLSSPRAISANGRFVAAENSAGDVVVRDRRLGRQRAVRPATFGVPAGWLTWVGVADSGDRVVVRVLVDDPEFAENPYSKLFVLDLGTGTSRQLRDADPVGLSADGTSLAVNEFDDYVYSIGADVISLDTGSYTSFPTSNPLEGSTQIADLAGSGRCALLSRRGFDNEDSGSTNPVDGYLEDLVTHTSRVITTDRAGHAVGGEPVAVSGDCSTVAFWTTAELVPGVGGDGDQHLFVRRLDTGRTTAVRLDGVPVARQDIGSVRLDPHGRQLAFGADSGSGRRFMVSALPAGPSVDIAVPGLISGQVSGNGRVALLDTSGATPLLVRERVWP